MRSILLTAVLALQTSYQPRVLADQKTPAAPPSIQAVPFQGQQRAADTPIRLTGSEFELLSLQGYTGVVTWDVTTPDGSALPVHWIICPPKSIVVGYRVGQTAPDKYDTPDSVAVAVFAKSSGRAVVAAWGIVDSAPKKLATLLIDANVGPRPPPGPTPPPPGPQPIPATGFRVLFAYESADKLTRAQSGVLNSTKIREYLQRKCVKVNNVAEARWWDKDVDLKNESETWRKIWDATKPQLTNLPAVVVINDTKGEVFPLKSNVFVDGKHQIVDMTEDEVLTLLKKYGGD